MFLMISKWWGGWVWMVVVLGFGFVHSGERVGRKRDKNEREIVLVYIYIYFIV